MTRTASNWRSLAAVALGAVVALFGIDRWLTAGYGQPVLAEVHDGVAGLAAGAPRAVVIGSSHARSFLAVDRLLRERTGGAAGVAPIAVEYGKLSSYAWVLENRVAPLLDGDDAATVRRRQALRQLILVTEWWDSTPATNGRREGDGVAAANLPSRAWTLPDFVADVASRGLGDYNRNYLSATLQQLAGDSVLVRDRGQRQLLARILDDGRGLGPEVRAQRVAYWQRLLEEGDQQLLAPAEMAAFDRIAAFAAAHHLELVVVLYPRKPDTITAKARATTLRRFATAIAERCRRLEARCFDWTECPALRDDDFLDDFDHLAAPATGRLAAWALDGDLAFLAAPR